MADLEAEIIAHIQAGLIKHDQVCPLPAKAILLHPANHEVFGYDELFGIPVLPDNRVQPKQFEISCDGSAFGIEEALAQFASPEQPLVIPDTVPDFETTTISSNCGC